MTRVCLVGDPEVNVQFELLSRETSREALSTYDLERPFENSLSVRTVSIGGAVSLLNDLQWYIVRFVDEALVLHPSVSQSEWLSRELATAVRNNEVEPDETGEFCKIYGLEPVSEDDEFDLSTAEDDQDSSTDDSDDTAADGSAKAETESTAVDEPESADGESARTGDESDDMDDPDHPWDSSTPQYRLVEPLYARRVDGEVPAYDLRDVEETLVVRVTEAEFSP